MITTAWSAGSWTAAADRWAVDDSWLFVGSIGLETGASAPSSTSVRSSGLETGASAPSSTTVGSSGLETGASAPSSTSVRAPSITTVCERRRPSILERVTEQSPWGVPPPTYQAPGAPAQPPGGWQAPPSYGGPSGPPPRRRTGVVLGVVAAVLVVVAAFTVTLLVASDDDDQPDVASDTGSDTPSQTTSESSDAPPGDTIAGDGYTFELPGVGWEDALDRAEELDAGPTIDAFIILGSNPELAQSNIIVEELSAGGAASVDDLAGQWKRNLSGTDGATIIDIDDIEIDGERAIGTRIPDRINVDGLEITQVAYLTIHDGRQYSIGLTLQREGDPVSEADFERFLDSWRWTS